MAAQPDTLLLALFPVLFLAMWITITTVLGALSGWFSLQNRYPDNGELASYTVRRQSGSMGIGVAMSGILMVGACRSGLRVGIWRVFGPFQRPFLVPWEDIRTEPKKMLFAPAVKLRFGHPQTGSLTIDTRIWERLAAAQPGFAAIPRTIPVSTSRIAIGLALQWALLTAFAATFFYLASHSAPATAPIPLALCIGFPAIVVGIPQLLRFLRQAR